jgi:hypothetical protein
LHRNAFSTILRSNLFIFSALFLRLLSPILPVAFAPSSPHGSLLPQMRDVHTVRRSLFLSLASSRLTLRGPSENEADSAYCFDCTTLIQASSRSDRSPSCSSRGHSNVEYSSSEASYESTNSDYESSQLATTIPSDSEPEWFEDCTPQFIQHPLYQASPRFLAMTKSPPSRLKAPLLLPYVPVALPIGTFLMPGDRMPSAPIITSVSEHLLTPSDEPLSLPTSLPLSSATAMLESAQEQNRNRITRRHTEADVRRPYLGRFGVRKPTREAVTFYLNSEDENEDELPPLDDLHNTSGRLKRVDSGIVTPTRPRSSLANSLSRLNLAGDEKDVSTDTRRGRSREVSKGALYAAERAARSRHASSGSPDSWSKEA